MKNQPKLKLWDLLRRRHMTLKQFLDEFGITTFDGMLIRCNNMGVAAPSQSEFDAVGIKQVSNPTEGIIVLEPLPVPTKAPVTPSIVASRWEENVPVSPTPEGTQKKARKKKDVAQDE